MCHVRCFTQRDLAELSWSSSQNPPCSHGETHLEDICPTIQHLMMEEAYTSWTTCDCEGKQNGTCLVRREIQPTRFSLEIYASKHEWTIYIWKKKITKRGTEWIAKCQAQIWVAKDVSCTFEQAPLLSGQEGWVEHATFGVGWTFPSGTRFKRTVSLWASLMVRRCGFGCETSP